MTISKLTHRLFAHLGRNAARVILAMSLLLTLAVSAFVYLSVQREGELRFQALTDRLTNRVRTRLERYTYALIQTRSLFTTGLPITREVFHDYAAGLDLLRSFPGIQGLGYVERIPPERLGEHVARIRREGFDEYQVWPGTRERRDHYPIVYLEPFDWRNRRAFGFDMTSESTRSEAMSRARDTGAPAMSGIVKLVQETDVDPQPGFLIYVPLYDDPLQPADPAARRAALRGFVYSPYRALDFFEAILSKGNSELDPSIVAFEVYAGPRVEPDALLYRRGQSSPREEGWPGGRIERSMGLEFGGSRWLLRYRSLPGFVPAALRYAPLATLLLGILLSLAFYAIARAIRSQAERERKLMRELLLKSEALEHSLNGFDIIDAGGKFVYVNRAYLRMWGYDRPEEVLGTSPADHCADPETPARIIRALKEKGECEIEFLARRKDGSTFNVRMWARRAFDPDGREIYPTTSIDITEQVRLYREIQESVRARDEFLSIASHELKTPVTTLKLQFQMAQRSITMGDPEVFSKERVEKRIDTANRQLKRLTRLIEDMLDVSRISIGKLSMSLERIDLVALASDVLDRFEEQLRAADVVLDQRLPPDPVWIEADRYRIEQVLENLLTNAIKYGRGRPIEVSLASEGDRAVLRVRDQGLGIAREDLERVFHRFERAVSPSWISGLGIGLYISKMIVESHGGRIRVESRLGEGSKFEVELPRAPAGQAAA